MTTPRATSETRQVWSPADLARDPHEAEDKARRVQRMFAAIAASYDLNNRLHSLWRDQAWRRRAVRLCRVGPDDVVLDAACGTGDLAEAFAAGGAARVWGVDFTAPMLRIARRKAARLPPTRRPEYVRGDVTALPFADGSFDVVSIAFGIRNVASPARALDEFHRVLRPGGRLIILEFSRPSNPLLRRLDGWYREHVMPVTATLISGDRTGAYRYLPRSVATFADRDELAGMMEAAGFESVAQHPMTFGVCVGLLAYRPAGVR